MSERDLSSLVDNYINEARRYDRSDLAQQREDAIRFYDGEVDIPPAPGRSAATSHDVSDVLDWMLAGLLRVFTASDRVAIYEPREPKDEPGAKQATDGINYIFMTECDGFRIIKDLMHDGLLHGNGVGKVWWAGEPEYKTEIVRGLPEMELYALASEPGVEILEQTEYFVGPDGQRFNANGEPMDDDEKGTDGY